MILPSLRIFSFWTVIVVTCFLDLYPLQLPAEPGTAKDSIRVQEGVDLMSE